MCAAWMDSILQAHGESSEIARLSDEVKAIVGECEQHAMRARNRIPTERDLLLNNDVSDLNCIRNIIKRMVVCRRVDRLRNIPLIGQFQIVDEIASTVGALEKVAHILHHMCTVASTQVSMSPGMWHSSFAIAFAILTINCMIAYCMQMWMDWKCRD